MIDLAQNPLYSALQKVATGPEYSKNLNYDEARQVMAYILSGEADPVQAGIFLIALRMKRETSAEGRGILRAIKDLSPQVRVDIDALVDLSDPYDGYIRGIPTSAFLPAVLAAAGYPCVSHGLASVGPKFGVTHHRILRAAGKRCNLSIEAVKTNLEDRALGWSYLDQIQYCPALHDLIHLRERIVKRQIINTVEALAQPLRANGQTLRVGGYVHKAYPPIYTDLARHAGFEQMILVRGIEGGITPSLKQAGHFYSFVDQREESVTELNPLSIGISQPSRNLPLPPELDNGSVDSDKLDQLAELAVVHGLSALRGQSGASRDSLMYSGAMIIHFIEQTSLAQAADKVKKLLRSGKALEKFQQHP